MVDEEPQMVVVPETPEMVGAAFTVTVTGAETLEQVLLKLPVVTVYEPDVLAEMVCVVGSVLHK